MARVLSTELGTSLTLHGRQLLMMLTFCARMHLEQTIFLALSQENTLRCSCDRPVLGQCSLIGLRSKGRLNADYRWRQVQENEFGRINHEIGLVEGYKRAMYVR